MNLFTFKYNILLVLTDFLDFQIFLLVASFYFSKNSKIRYRHIFLYYAAYIFREILFPFPYSFVIELFIQIFYLKQVIRVQLKKCFAYLLIYQIAYYAVYTLISLIVQLFSRTMALDRTLYNTYMEYLDTLCITILYIIIFFYINFKRARHANPRDNIINVCFFALSLLCIFLLMYLNQAVWGYPELASMYFYIYISVIGIELLNIYLYTRMLLSLETQTMQEVQIKKYQYEYDYAKDIDASLKQVSKIRHDFKNQLIVLDSYAKQGRYEELTQYIAKLQNGVTATRLYDTSNALISAILNAKNMQCEKKQIDFQVTHSIGKILIDDFYIMTVLGNILDNAITAAAEVSHGYICLSITQIDSYLEIVCRNNHAGNIIKKHNVYVSTKKDTRAMHGLGIENIKECAEKLNGTVDIHHDAKEFYISVMLPNYADVV